MKRIKLSKRLSVIAGFIEKGASVADIGTDHGYIPIYLAQNGLAEYIIASDIAKKPLVSAIQNAVEYNVADKISFVTAPGLDGIAPGEADTIIIAGMGGETIAGILDGAEWIRSPAVRLVLQPQTKTGELCRYLRETGFAISDASLADDGGRLYTVMAAEYAERDSATEGAICTQTIPESELLSVLGEKHDPLFTAYMEQMIMKTRRAAEGLQKSGATDYSNMAERLYRLTRIKEEAEKWQL